MEKAAAVAEDHFSRRRHTCAACDAKFPPRALCGAGAFGGDSEDAVVRLLRETLAHTVQQNGELTARTRDVGRVEAAHAATWARLRSARAESDSLRLQLRALQATHCSVEQRLAERERQCADALRALTAELDEQRRRSAVELARLEASEKAAGQRLLEMRTMFEAEKATAASQRLNPAVYD